MQINDLDEKVKALTSLFPDKLSNHQISEFILGLSGCPTQVQSTFYKIGLLFQEVDSLKGESRKEKLGQDVYLPLVKIPSGSFLMGSSNELGNTYESPQHIVKVSSFWLGQYPVTQAQWRVVAGLPQVNRALKPSPSKFKGEDLPVENINWYEAVEFCARLSKHTGRQYRLPSEAEWEYACRAGTTTAYHFGETISTDLANYDGKFPYGNEAKGLYRAQTTEVGSFKVANAFGLYDMHGNVWEWCQDHWHDDYENAPADGSAWTTGGDDAERVVRGGSWVFSPWDCRSAFRLYVNPRVSYSFIGFRVVCDTEIFQV